MKFQKNTCKHCLVALNYKECQLFIVLLKWDYFIIAIEKIALYRVSDSLYPSELGWIYKSIHIASASLNPFG